MTFLQFKEFYWRGYGILSIVKTLLISVALFLGFGTIQFPPGFQTLLGNYNTRREQPVIQLKPHLVPLVTLVLINFSYTVPNMRLCNPSMDFSDLSHQVNLALAFPYLN